MGCYVINKFARKYGKVGLTSIKPKVGRGSGNIHCYTIYHKDQGFAAYAYLTYSAAESVLERIAADGINLYVNALQIVDPKGNVRETRNIFLFFRHDADWFIFKTYLHQIDHSLISDDNDSRLRKPQLFSLRK